MKILLANKRKQNKLLLITKIKNPLMNLFFILSAY